MRHFGNPDMVTIFAIPKPFQEKTGVIQRNAILSWTNLKPLPEIILFGDEKGTAQLASELELQHVPQIARNEYNTPLLDDLFLKAQRISQYDTLCYVNADIILLNDFINAVRKVAFTEYLMVGQRFDLVIDKPIDFSSPGWEGRLRAVAEKRGQWHGHTGIDYFVFSRGLFSDIPPFAIGRTMWDNWLIYKARSLKVPVIDATRMIKAIHQEHDYSQHPEGEKWIKEGPEATGNLELGGGWSHVFTLEDTSLVLTPQGLEKIKLTRKRLCRQLERLVVLRPGFSFWARLVLALLSPRRLLGAISKRISMFFHRNY
jgi:hypothetical protein